MNRYEPRYYILKDKRAVRVTDMMTWAMWFGTHNRIVAQDRIGPISISTVFLGLDHSYDRNGPAHIFETMVFRGGNGDEQYRCATWEQAEAQHKEAVEMVRAEIKKKAIT